MGGRLTALLSSALPVNVYGNQLVHDLHHNNPMQPILGSLLYNKTYLSIFARLLRLFKITCTSLSLSITHLQD
jgi:hypothetical protein